MSELLVDELVVILRRERHLLRLLLFKFVCVGALLDRRELRFLPWAAREADRARQQVREIDLVRAAAVERLHLRGLRDGSSTLREVAAVANEPSATMLRDHHEALCTLVAEIELIGHACAGAARAGIAELAREASAPLRPASVTTDPTTPTDEASLHRAVVAEQLEDEELGAIGAEAAFQAALEGTGKLRIPSLLAFLR